MGGTPGMGAYQSAKFAVEGFSEVLVGEVDPIGIRVVIAEPGTFRTDRQGSSMELRAVGADHADYEETVGLMNKYWAENNGSQPGDPIRAARVLIDIAHHDDPPRRILRGAQAVAIGLEADEARAVETRALAEARGAADFPGEADNTMF